MSNYVAYIDESGDPNFADGASKTFVLCAIVFKREDLHLLSGALDRIKVYYNMRELKSSHVRSFEERYDILQQLLSSAPKIITICFDKDALFGDWFRYRSTFYKYAQRLLNHELYRIFGSISVTMDRYGSPQYRKSLKEYLLSKLQMELFDPDLMVASAKDIDFIQASDFLAGSIRKTLEGDFVDQDNLIDIIKPFWVRRIQLPDTGSHVGDIPDSYSGVLLGACMDEARRYLNKHKSTSNDPRIRTLEYLYYSAIDGSNEYIFTHEILEWLTTLGFTLSEEQFRSEVLASLRDDGLIIAGSRRGIKIPRTPEDIRDYINFNINLALPVLRRLKKAIEFVRVRTELADISSLLSDEMKAILKEVNA